MLTSIALRMYYKNWRVRAVLLNNMTDDEFETETKKVIVDLLRNGWTKKELIEECRMTLDRLNPKKINGSYLTREEWLCLAILALFKDDDVRIDSVDLEGDADPMFRMTAEMWRFI